MEHRYLQQTKFSHLELQLYNHYLPKQKNKFQAKALHSALLLAS